MNIHKILKISKKCGMIILKKVTKIFFQILIIFLTQINLIIPNRKKTLQQKEKT